MANNQAAAAARREGVWVLLQLEGENAPTQELAENQRVYRVCVGLLDPPPLEVCLKFKCTIRDRTFSHGARQARGWEPAELFYGFLPELAAPKQSYTLRRSRWIKYDRLNGND